MELDDYMIEQSKMRLNELLKDESEIKAYLSHDAFKNNRQRANAGLQPIFDLITDILTLGIIKHREVEHNETYDKEKEITISRMDTETVEIVQASTVSWWMAG